MPVFLTLFAALFPIVWWTKQPVIQGLWQHVNGAAISAFFFYTALWGGVFIYLNNCRGRDKKIVILLLIFDCMLQIALAIWPGVTVLELYQWAFLSTIFTWLFCIVSAGNNLWHEISTVEKLGKTDWTPALLCFFMPIFAVLTCSFLYLTALLDHTVNDHVLYAIDATLGFYPSFLLGRLFILAPLAVRIFIYVIYVALPFAWMLAYVYYEKKLKIPPLGLIMECAVAGILSMLAYHIIPAYGPINAFNASWPWYPPNPLTTATTFVYMGIDPRNCMPSLHTIWALCIWRHVQSCGRSAQFIATIWLCVLLVSTLALGEHYLIDIVVSFAFTAMVRGICATSLPLNNLSRISAIVTGGGLCLGWFFLIEFGLDLLRLSSILSCSLYFITVGLACLVEYRLTCANFREREMPVHC